MAQMSAKKMKLLEDLQAVDFVLAELTLYLDTHPDDAEVLQQYQETAEKRQEIKSAVETQFGALCRNTPLPEQNTPGWDEGPWPWQL